MPKKKPAPRMAWPKPGAEQRVPLTTPEPPERDPDVSDAVHAARMDAWEMLSGIDVTVRLLSAARRNALRHQLAALHARERGRLNKLAESGEYDLDYLPRTSEFMSEYTAWCREITAESVVAVHGGPHYGDTPLSELSGDELLEALEETELLTSVGTAANSAQTPRPRQLDC